MSIRTAAVATTLLALSRKMGAAIQRFVKNEPRTATEQRVFIHLNGLIDTLTTHFMRRKFAPLLKAV